MEEWLYIQNEAAPALLRGFWVSLQLIVPSAILGLLLGILVGTLRVFGNRALAAAANAFVTLFRGVPLVVQLFVWYFGLPYWNIYLSPFAAAILGFTLCSAAYHSEYVRGALLSIRRGQMLAAHALGFTRTQTILSVILPQALRKALPGCGNEIIYLIKYSSLAYMITCIELTGEGKILASDSFKYTEIFLLVGLCYLVMTTLATLLLQTLETRLKIPGFEHRAF
jgi:polar amino acid transport system permease protein